MGGNSQESGEGERRVSIAAHARRNEMVAFAVAAGWTVTTGDEVPVLVVDLAPVDAARRDRAAVLAIGDAAAAYAAGSTHWLAPDFSERDFVTALAFAGRYARRLRHQPYEAGGRRADDAARERDDPVAAWLDARLANGGACAIVVALTRFEIVNAAFGRATGDALMVAAQARIAHWAESAFGRDAPIVRGDGAEIVVAGIGRAPVATLDAALARPFEVDGVAVNLGSRIGLAESVRGEDAAVLIRRARHALAEAHASDGATTHVATAAAGLDGLAADLHHALERDEIVVRFQPQVTIATGAIGGVEALARWEHPSLGVLSAERLFAAAERADLGIALSDHIQRLALARAAAWPEALARVRLSINVTAADLARPGFADAFLDRIATSGFARGRVTVEIVETGLIEDLDRAAAILARLRGAGCRIAIDDFGTGYSSLAYLKALPIDYLKIDRSLTRDITGSDRDRIIVRGVIAIARSLGLETIAEGVETEEECALLASEGCDLYQGFLCAGALDSDVLAELVGG